MNWNNFQTYNDSPNHAFEVMCNQLFELWCRREYKNDIQYFTVVNGAGGDGGVEAYMKLINGEIVAIQSNWFPTAITDSQISQIRNSVRTARKIRPNIKRYVVCIPRDLASKKSIKNNGIAQITESCRWENLKKELEENYEGLQIELWNETRILTELQQPEAVGIFKFWFQKGEISEQTIINSFEKQKCGWLSQKYIGSLHTPGYIHKLMNQFLGTFKLNQEKLKDYKKLVTAIDNIIESATELLNAIADNEEEKNNVDILNDSIEKSKQFKKQVNELIEIFRHCGNSEEVRKEIVVDYFDLEDMIEKHKFHDKLYFHYHDIKSALKGFYEENNNSVLYYEEVYGNKLIISGNPGAGKTHGITSEGEKLLTSIHTPILIRAKSVTSNDTWLSMLKRTLGLSDEWSEEEIFNAIESITYRKEIDFVRSHGDSEVRVIPKIVICIDGLDESRPYDVWLDRIRETEAFMDRFKRIKFVFLSRPYVFDKANCREKLYKSIKSLPSEGDTSVRKLFDGYIKYYNIDLNSNEWIKNVITTPLALRLFCEEYRGKRINNNIDKRNLTVTKLYARKINLIDQEFREKVDGSFDERDFIIRRCLNKLADIFSTNEECEREVLLRYLKSDAKLASCRDIQQLLNYLENYGFLQSYVQESEVIFDIPITYYLIGTQPSFDYLLSCKAFEKYDKGEVLEIDNKFSMGALQMLSIQLLEEKHKLIFQCDNLKLNLSNRKIFGLVCYSLANVSLDIAKDYTDYVMKLMGRNADYLRAVLKQIILPVVNVQNHPLGSELFHKYMMSFEKPAQRDLLWSLPTYLRSENSEIWVCREEFDLIDSYEIGKDDCYIGLPLIYAWALTNVENSKRSNYRKSLMKWGLYASEEFYKLFCIVIKTNDPQMREDLLSIAYSICMNVDININFLEKICDWVIDNIFSTVEAPQNVDAAIRYYGRAIVEIAYTCGIIQEDQIKIARPPYAMNEELLPISINALDSSRMGGYEPIDYDLARYVLCDPITGSFFDKYDNMYSSKYTLTSDKLLQLYKEKYSLEKLEADQLIISLAYKFILECGWNVDEFWYKRENYSSKGADIAILGRYTAATHGQMSSVMTVAEKYVWCGKYKLLAYLADRLPKDNYENGVEFVTDYGSLEDFPNSLQELVQIDTEMESSKWIFPEELAKSIEGIENDKDGIKMWLNKAKLPKFESWISIGKNKITLYGYNSITNPKSGICEDLWISSGVVKKEELEDFINVLDYDKDSVRYDFMNPERFHSSPADTVCYLTPIEVCRLQYKKEDYDTVILKQESKEIKIYKAVEECVSNFVDSQEIPYKLPSRIIRNFIGITYGDGFMYHDNDRITVGTYTRTGENWGDSQYLLQVNEELLLNKLDEAGYQMFWLVRTLREPSIKVRERYKDFHDYVDRCFVVWLSDKQWKQKELHEKKISQ